MACSLHTHSQFSPMDGVATAKEIAQRCIDIGQTACTLTDHGTVAGHLEFARAFDAAGLKPIYGIEAYHGNKTDCFEKNERDAAHFIMLAKNDKGLRNLWRLADAASTNYRHVCRMSWDMLREYREGIIATSACMSGLVAKGVMNDDLAALDKYLSIYGSDFYIELHTYTSEKQWELNRALASIANDRGIGVTYATDAHFAFPEQYPVYNAYMCKGDTVFTPKEERRFWHPPGMHIQSDEEIREHLANSGLSASVIDEAIANTDLIAASCDAQLPEVRRHMPVFIPSECMYMEEEKEMSADDAFLSLVAKGVEWRYGKDADPKIWDRASRECKAFIDAGFSHYFLITWDICKFADSKNMMRGPGRGSAGGCLVSYALGITGVDPLKYDLIFERFYNPGRASSMPDIDLDFPKAQRKNLKRYLQHRWGKDRVKTIGTVTRLKPKEAVNKTYKAFGITPTEKAELIKIVEKTPDIDILGPDSVGWDSTNDPGKEIYVMDSVGPEIIDWISKKPTHHQDTIAQWLELVSVVCGRVANYGVHPSGVIISDVDLNDEMPCSWSRDQEEAMTMFPMTEVDKRQFLKEDILGLQTIDALELWETISGIKLDGAELIDNELNLDPEMWKLLADGITTGVFQLGTNYATKLCKEIKPTCVADLGLIVALNRPGPIRSGAPDKIIARRAGLEQVEYDHPFLEDILKPTYGLFLYQESVIKFFEKLGYSASEADAVRSILGKKKTIEMKKLRAGEGEWAGKGYNKIAGEILGEKAAGIIWDQIEDFAKYSFNKSHAIAYGCLALWTLWAKYKAPAEFYVAFAKVFSDEQNIYLSEAMRTGIEVLPPRIRKSQVDLSVVNGEILFGLASIKGIGVGTAKRIISVRDSYPVDTELALKLAISIERKKEDVEQEQTGVKKQKITQVIKSNVIDALVNAGAFDDTEPRQLSAKERRDLEIEYLSVAISDRKRYEEVVDRNFEKLRYATTFEDAEEGGDSVVAGYIAEVKLTETKAKKEEMAILTIEDGGSGSMRLAIFPQRWSYLKPLVEEGRIGRFAITINERGGSINELLILN